MIPQVGGFQGCYLDNHRNNWRCARTVPTLCENTPKEPRNDLFPLFCSTLRRVRVVLRAVQVIPAAQVSNIGLTLAVMHQGIVRGARRELGLECK